jgi:HSP20 family protein
MMNLPISYRFDWPRNAGLLSTAMDVIERPDSFLVNVELPGVRKEDISVNVENGILTVMGERKEVKKEEDDRYYHVERRYGNIKRIIAMPVTADADNVKAELNDGVLSLAFAKRDEQGSRKQITVS